MTNPNTKETIGIDVTKHALGIAIINNKIPKDLSFSAAINSYKVKVSLCVFFRKTKRIWKKFSFL